MRKNIYLLLNPSTDKTGRQLLSKTSLPLKTVFRLLKNSVAGDKYHVEVISTKYLCDTLHKIQLKRLQRRITLVSIAIFSIFLFYAKEFILIKFTYAIKPVVEFSSQKVPLQRKSDFAVSNISVLCSSCITVCTLGNFD